MAQDINQEIQEVKRQVYAMQMVILKLMTDSTQFAKHRSDILTDFAKRSQDLDEEQAQWIIRMEQATKELSELWDQINKLEVN